MNRTWRLTDLEFFVLWEDRKEDLLPRPFSFVSRTPLYDDFVREKRETRERLRARLDRDLEDVLDTVAQPDVRVVVHGWDDRGRDDPKGRIRLHVVRRGEQAYLLTQLPGETIRHSGGITITECEPLAIANAAVARLPDVKAGRLADVALPDRIEDGDTDYGYGRSTVDDPLVDDSVEYRREQFLRTPTNGMGKIVVAQGVSRFGPRGITSRTLHWRDLADDGRYAIAGDNPPIARRVDSKQLTALTNTHIAEVIRAIKDERA